MDSFSSTRNKEEKLSVSEIKKKLMNYDIKRWQENRGKYVEFDIKTENKYKKYFEDIESINPDGDEGMGVDQLEEPFISLGLAYSKEEVADLIASVDDDNSGRIEFGEFLRIIHNKSRKKAKGNEKITQFFKDLSNNTIGNVTDFRYFSFKTIMGILRRDNLLKAFLSDEKRTKEDSEKVLKAYAMMLEKRK